MRYLFDTAAFIHAATGPERLSKRAIAILRNNSNVIEVSAISFLELGAKSGVGKSSITMQQTLRYIDDLKFNTLPYLPEHASPLFTLPLHHRDPFDRALIAQAIVEEIPIVTPDDKFPKYMDVGLKVIW